MIPPKSAFALSILRLMQWAEWHAVISIYEDAISFVGVPTTVVQLVCISA